MAFCKNKKQKTKQNKKKTHTQNKTKKHTKNWWSGTRERVVEEFLWGMGVRESILQQSWLLFISYLVEKSFFSGSALLAQPFKNRNQRFTSAGTPLSLLKSRRTNLLIWGG